MEENHALLTPSTVLDSSVVVGVAETEAVIEELGCESRDQGYGGVEAGACNGGGEIVVQVLGSDVYVDGMSSVAAVVDPNDEPSHYGSSRESLEREKGSVFAGETDSCGPTKQHQMNPVGNFAEVWNPGIGNVLEESLAVKATEIGSSATETQVVGIEEDVDMINGEGLEGGLVGQGVEKGVDRIDEAECSLAMAEASCGQTLDVKEVTKMAGEEGSEGVSLSQEFETQVAGLREDVEMINGELSETGLVGLGVEKGVDLLDDIGDSLDDLTSKKNLDEAECSLGAETVTCGGFERGVESHKGDATLSDLQASDSNNIVTDTGIETVVEGSLDVVKPTCEQTEVIQEEVIGDLATSESHEDKVADIGINTSIEDSFVGVDPPSAHTHDESLNPKDDNSVSDALNDKVAGRSSEFVSCEETTTVVDKVLPINQNFRGEVAFGSMEKGNEVVNTGEIAAVSGEEVLHDGVEAADAGIDASDRNLHCTVENQQPDRVDGAIVAPTNSEAPLELIHIAAGDTGSVHDKVSSPNVGIPEILECSEDSQNLKAENAFGNPRNYDTVHANSEPRDEVAEIDDGRALNSKGELSGNDASGGNTGCSIKDEEPDHVKDPESCCEQAQIVELEATEFDYSDRISAPSENDHNFTVGEEIAAMDIDEGIQSKIGTGGGSMHIDVRADVESSGERIATVGRDIADTNAAEVINSEVEVTRIDSLNQEIAKDDVSAFLESSGEGIEITSNGETIKDKTTSDAPDTLDGELHFSSETLKICVIENEIDAGKTEADAQTIQNSEGVLLYGSTDKDGLIHVGTEPSEVDFSVVEPLGEEDVYFSRHDERLSELTLDKTAEEDNIVTQVENVSPSKLDTVTSEPVVNVSFGPDDAIVSVSFVEEEETEVDKHVIDTEWLSENTVHRASYELPQPEREFSVHDLVWGKVRSHPWWPGQIFDPSDGSEKAMRYHKKDNFLVAYFGDHTFAWNDASQLKPFLTHFSQEEKQSNTDSFQNAVNCCLDEVSRRVELGLACSCVPKEGRENIKVQIVENAGIREESSRREGVDRYTSATDFEPDRLVEYVKALAQVPSSGGDRLELVIAKAQLLAFYRSKGYSPLPEFHFGGGLLGSDEDMEADNRSSCGWLSESSEDLNLKTKNRSSHKRKHNLKDIVYNRKREKSLLELMAETPYIEENRTDEKLPSKPTSPSYGKKRKALDIAAEEPAVQDKRRSGSLSKVLNPTSPNPKPSFKVGDCIRRVASQLTGSHSMQKCSSSEMFSNKHVEADLDVSFQTYEDASPDELLSLLHIAAQEPMKGYSFFSVVISFFSNFRSLVYMGPYNKKENLSTEKINGTTKVRPPEAFEFDDKNDSYWTDRVIENGPEELPSTNNQKREMEPGKPPLTVTVEPKKSHVGLTPRTYSRKRKANEKQNMQVEAGLTNYIDDKDRYLLPAALTLNFAEVDSVPSNARLNRMFSRFGPLKELETEVDWETNRARVVFKRGSDAEVAFSSAVSFGIFGQKLVNYELNFSPLNPFRAPSLAITEAFDYAT